MQSNYTDDNFQPDNYYHLQTIATGQDIFLDGLDCAYFITLFQRHLSRHARLDQYGRPYKNYGYDIELIAYSLTPGRIDLLIRQLNDGSLAVFMRSVLSSYSRYFKKRHGFDQPVFPHAYQAIPITTPAQLKSVSSLIHTRPNNWREHRYSSLPFYLHYRYAEWLRPDRVLEHFAATRDYLAFVETSDSR